MKLKAKLFLGIGLSLSTIALAQEGKVYTGAPFLRISPDSRAGGMGDQGVATSTDAFSQYWNAAKYPFSTTSSAIALNYTPWMGKLVNDTFLLYAAYHQFLGQEERSTISASIYYFNMGSIDFRTLPVGGGDPEFQGTAKPNEFSIDVAYGLKLSDSYSMAVTGRFIRSDLAGSFNSDNTLQPANSFAIDVAGYYQTPKHTSFGGYEGKARAGWAIQNIGPRLDYTGNDDSRSYLPTTARLGAGYDLYIDDENKVGITLEASKLLVAGQEITGYDTDGSPIYGIPNVGVVEGIGKSFKNKQSLMYSGGLEYSYADAFAVRGGYFRESELQGARQYATVGLGLKYQSFGLDLSYLINTSKVNSALDNTLRFGLTWNIGQATSNADN